MEKHLENKDTHQVYFMTCPAHMPFHFAIHPWVVCIKNGEIHRWEVIHKKYPDKESFGFIYKDFYSDPWKGIKKHSFSIEHWDAKILTSYSGDQTSLAAKIIEFIEERSPFYSHQENYTLFPGPNSNTYISWILSSFPEIQVSLPWNAFGKNYK